MAAQEQQPPLPRARLLDLSRLVSRVGRGPLTGVDRVEAAYLEQLLNDPVAFYTLVRTGMGYVLLNRDGARQLSARIHQAQPWGAPDLLSRLFLKARPAKRAAESDLRRFCIARCGRGGLAAMLARHLPSDVAYLNVGHSNLQSHVFDAVQALPGGRVTVLIHDTIPLDFPQYQRPGSAETFAARLRRVGAQADLVIYNSRQSQQDAERHFAEWGRVPPGMVALLGVTAATPDPRTIPANLDLSAPYFVTVGTIEPRKNHALLLDIWDHFAANPPPGGIPQLFIIGNRGWNNDAVFRRLDRLSPTAGHVHELNDLEDGAMAALVRGARAMLFPSHAEGYGLPPCEAALLGVPVVLNDLAVYREILGNIPIYANTGDMYSWAKIITGQAEENEAAQVAKTGMGTSRKLPTWQDHFNLVLKVT